VAIAELGNLTARIVLPPSRMSTVKIRARSLFRNPPDRNWASGACFGDDVVGFSSAFHKTTLTFTECTQEAGDCDLQKTGFGVQSRKKTFEVLRNRAGDEGFDRNLPSVQRIRLENRLRRGKRQL
jgi:hypothetical protein